MPPAWNWFLLISCRCSHLPKEILTFIQTNFDSNPKLLVKPAFSHRTRCVEWRYETFYSPWIDIQSKMEKTKASPEGDESQPAFCVGGFHDNRLGKRIQSVSQYFHSVPCCSLFRCPKFPVLFVTVNGTHRAPATDQEY